MLSKSQYDDVIGGDTLLKQYFSVARERQGQGKGGAGLAAGGGSGE